MTCPCKDCFRRKINCHGACDEYKAWRDWKDEVNRRKTAEKALGHISRDHEMKIRKLMKGLR